MKKINEMTEIVLDMSCIREREQSNRYLLAILGFVSAFCICMGFYDGFGISTPAVIFIVIAFILSVATQVCLSSSRNMKIGLPVLAILIVIYSAVCGMHFVNGMTGIINQVISYVNETMAQANVKYVVDKATLDKDIILASVTVCAVVTVLFNIALRYKRMAMCTALLLGSSMINMMYKGTEHVIWIVMSLVCTFAMYYFLNIRIARVKGSLSHGYMITCILTAVSIAFALLVQYSGIESVDELKDEIIYHGGNIVYGKSDYPEGQLKRYHEVTTDDEVKLKVDMPGVDELHLKGYVGCKYTEKGWTKNDENIYGGDYTGMIDWFRDNNFYPLSQVSMYLQYSLDNGLEEDEVEGATIHVENLAASKKYEYTSENLAFYSLSTLISPKQDVNFVEQDLLGEKEYWFDIYTIEDDDYLNFPEQDWFNAESDGAEFVQAENVYRSFANRFYMDIPEYERKLFEQNVPECNNNVQNAVQVIRQYLKNEITYSEEVAPYESGKNYVEQVLLSDKRGYSPQFATIATLMFRYYGVPARYVEGYYVVNDENKDTVEVTTVAAHAWVEVYIKGLGFVPVEVTPGFYVEENAGGSGASDSNSDSSGGGGTMGSSRKEDLDIFDLNYGLILKYLLIIVLILLVVAAIGMVIRRMVICHRRKKQLASDNLYVVIAEAGSYIRDLYHFDGKNITQEIPAHIKNIFEKTRFSNHLLKREELEQVITYMQDVLEQTWKTQKMHRKLKMIFVNCLR